LQPFENYLSGFDNLLSAIEYKLAAMVKRKTYAPVPGQHISGQANKPLSQPPHSLTSQQVLDELCSNPDTGLRPEEVPRRLEEMGPNELEQKAGVQPVKIFLEQIFNAMTLVCDL
jgi:magnesium-transporting ATPase (P-type)